MAGYGSGSRPVNLGPFQRIVGVHWRSDRFIRVRFRIRVASEAQGESSTGPGPAFVEPFSEGFVTEATPEYADSAPEAVLWPGGSTGSGGISLSGVPDLPPALTFDRWKIQGINVPEHGLFAPFPRWLPGAGSPLPAPMPGGYLDNLTNNWEVVAQQFVGEPQITPFGGTGLMWATFSEDLVQQQQFAFDASDLTATYQGETYAPVGTQIEGRSQFSTGVLYVLLERQRI